MNAHVPADDRQAIERLAEIDVRDAADIIGVSIGDDRAGDVRRAQSQIARVIGKVLSSDVQRIPLRHSLPKGVGDRDDVEDVHPAASVQVLRAAGLIGGQR